MSESDLGEANRFSTIVVVGGGCYGSYYVRQLDRAAQAGAIEVGRIVVVDRDPDCRVARATAVAEGSAVRVELVAREWRVFFDQYLSDAAERGASRDAIVPSPLMPHLMGEWLVQRARDRWPGRRISTEPLDRAPAVPWERAGADGTHYVSFATWMCPINCVEPRTCPHTRSARTWTLPDTLRAYADDERARGTTVELAVLHCRHRAYGVGMFDTTEVVTADLAIARAGERGAADVLIGTVSHCHGALTRLSIGAPTVEAHSPVR